MLTALSLVCRRESYADEGRAEPRDRPSNEPRHVADGQGAAGSARDLRDEEHAPRRTPRRASRPGAPAMSTPACPAAAAAVAGSAIWGLLDSQPTRRDLRGSACSFLCSRCPLNCPP